MAPSGDRPENSGPKGVAGRLAARRDDNARAASNGRSDQMWRRETFRLPRADARETARAVFVRFPKAAYMTEIEWWRECENGEIEFTVRRLHSAD